MKKSAKLSIHVGCSGFGGSMESYPSLFDIIEIQHTFYQPPQMKTLAKWRSNVDPSFEFTIKAWQLITHASSSPTYRRLKQELTATESKNAGYFRDSKIVQSAWATTLECAEALQAKRILFQCPASFKPTKVNLENMRSFFSQIDRAKKLLFFEPRGADWTPQLVKDLCTELNIFHAVDPFVSESQTPEETYFRLHGKTGWRYVYTDEEIIEIEKMLPRKGTACIFFNNIKMREDASRFLELSRKMDKASQLVK